MTYILDSREIATLDHYARCGINYTHFDNSFPPHFLHAIAEVAGELHQPPHILDIGCGCGRALDGFGELVLRGILGYTGVDPSPVLLEHARTEYPQHEFRQGSFSNVQEVVTGKSDIFIANFSLCHVARGNVTAALANVRSVMRAGGYGFFLVPYGTEERVLTHTDFESIPDGDRVLQVEWTPETIEPFARAAGFECVRVNVPFVDWGVSFGSLRAV